MGAVLKITDKQPGQPAHESFELHLASERLTARELIRRRIADEVQLINARQVDSSSDREKSHSFLVQFEADPIESRLNTPKPMRKPAQLDEEVAFATAIEGFEANAFVMLFDNRQIEDLDDEVTVTDTSELVFLRLVPLVGG